MPGRVFVEMYADTDSGEMHEVIAGFSNWTLSACYALGTVRGPPRRRWLGEADVAKRDVVNKSGDVYACACKYSPQ